MDKYYVYRPILLLIQRFEGVWKKGRGYNETLSYGAYTGGDVNLVGMTLAEVDALQGRMLAHPRNKWNSSAAGAYQIVRRTKRGIEAKLKLDKSLLFDEDMQDRMACYLLGVRGIDKYLAGRLKEDTLLTNLSAEWASFPKPDGKGTYAGQGVGGKASEVRAALAEVRKRHKEGQPVEIVVPEEVQAEAEKVERRGRWQWPSAGILAVIGGVYKDYPELAWAATGGIVVIGIVALVGGRSFVRHVKGIVDEAQS